MTRAIEGEVVDCGFDWITSTASTRLAQERLSRLGQSIIRSEQKSGNEVKPWAFAGYQGFKCGSAQIGTRYDSTCLRISSGVAHENWLKAYQAGEGFPRVDVQITMRVPGDPQRVIARCYRHALTHTRKRKRGPNCSILKSSNGSATVYLGRRQSGVFLRCYDKGRESGLDHYENCVRFEGEFKGAVGLPIARHCAGSKSPNVTAASYVLGHFADRGVVLECAVEEQYSVRVPRKRSDTGRRLAWLQTQVSPSVRLLIASGHRADVLRALGLSASVTKASGKVEALRSIRFGGR